MRVHGTAKTVFLLLVLLSALPIAAQIHPPAPGVELPESYLERRRADRTVFTFQRAWFGRTERARETRRLIAAGEAHKLGPDANPVVSGTFYVPVIAGKYSTTGSDPYSPVQLQDQLFDGPNPTGTIPDYYDEISYGALNMIGTVIANGSTLYQVAHNEAYYAGGCNGLCGTARTGEYLQELLDLSDPSTDFGLYDNDGPDGLPNSGDDDGYVDFVAFVQPNKGGECGGPSIWSHRWVYEGWWGVPYTTNDVAAGGGFIKVSDYTIQPLRACDGSSIIQIGVYAHEFGHAFGLPDLYDGDGSSEGIGEWGLMGSGSYGGDGAHPATPSHMCAWSKEQLGWVTPVELCEGSTGLSLPDVETTGQVLKVYPHGIKGSEYFLIENRVQTGFDQYIHASGLAVWHIDNDQPGNNNENLKLVDLEEADGLAQLDSGLNRGNAGDVFPGSSNKTVFDSASNPNSDDNVGVQTALAMTNVDGTVNPRGFDLVVPDCVLRLADVAVDDSACGSNNNGTLDSFETMDLQLCLADDFPTGFSGIVGTLSSLNPKITILQDTVNYGAIAANSSSCGASSFRIQVTNSVADAESFDFQLDLTGDDGYASTANFTLYGGQFVLLVEDDGGVNNRSYFTAAIGAAGYTYAVHDTDVDGIPALGLMASSLATVWYTGEAYEGTFTPGEQAVVASYLDGGGQLFVTGQDIGYDLVSQGSGTDAAFYADYFHAEFLSDGTTYSQALGIPLDPVGNGLVMDLTLGANNSTYASVIDPRPGATATMYYSGGIYNAGIRWETGHRLVYFAFNFESASASQQAAAMTSVLDHLIDGDLEAPTLTLSFPTAGATYPSCGAVVIAWGASDNVGITEVEILDSTDGGASWTSLVTLPGNPGGYVWNPGAISGTHRVRVIARDAGGLQGCDESGDFTIADTTNPTASVLAPNGNEVLIAGAGTNIDWSSSDDCSGVAQTEIFVSYDNGGIWNLIDTVLPPVTTKLWVVPATASTQCLVRVDVHDLAGNVGSDQSDAVFTIQTNPEVHAAVGSSAVLPVSLLSHPDGTGIPLSGAMQWNGVPGSTPATVDATIQITLTDGLGDPIVGFPAANVGVVSSAGGWSQCAGNELHADGPSDAGGNMTISGAIFAGGSSGLGELLEIVIDDPNLTSISYPGGAAGLDIRVNSVDINDDGISNLIDVGTLSIDLNGAYQYRSDFSWNGELNIADIGRFAIGLQTACPPAPQPELATAGDEIGIFFDLAATQRAGRLAPGEQATAYLLLKGPSADAGLIAWEASVESSENLEVVSSSLPAGSLDLGGARGWIVGTGGPAHAAKSGAPLLLATLRLRALDAEPATLGLAGVSAGMPLLATRDEELRAVAPSGGVLHVNDASVDASGRFVGYALGNHPNPFNPSTQIQFNLPQRGTVSLRIHDVAGRLVTELDAGTLSAGAHRVTWNGLDHRGASVTSGVYFVRLIVDGHDVGEPTKMSLLK